VLVSLVTQTLTSSYLGSLFGFFIVEGTDTDITEAPGVEGAREVLMILSEGLTNEDGTVPAIFPVAFEFNWTSVCNGYRAEDTIFEFEQGELILFRVASATVEPQVRVMSILRQHVCSE